MNHVEFSFQNKEIYTKRHSKHELRGEPGLHSFPGLKCGNVGSCVVLFVDGRFARAYIPGCRALLNKARKVHFHLECILSLTLATATYFLSAITAGA